MFMIIIWIASLWVLVLFCVPIVFFIWKTCIRTLMTIRMVSVTLISISVPSFFLSHSGGMPVCTIISEPTCPMFVEPTYFLTFYPYLFAAMVHCHWFELHPSQDPANCYSARRGSTSEHHRPHLHSPNKREGVHLWLFFGGAHGKQDREGTTIISI